MTLVIARRLQNTITFASDSRIGFPGNGTFDYGIKIFSVPAKIYSPTDATSGETPLLYDHRIGLAVIGGAINAYTVKDSVYEIFQHLQAFPGHTNLSFENIARLAFRVYEKSSEDLRQILGKNGFCEILFGGYCMVQNRVRVFEFTPDSSKNPISFEMNEILINKNIKFYGTGKDAAEAVFKQNPKYNTLQIIREVIETKAVKSVGGGLQFGDFDNNQFRVLGVTNYELDDQGLFKNYVHTLRGLSIFREEFERQNNGFHVAYTFVQPFQKEINDLLKY